MTPPAGTVTSHGKTVEFGPTVELSMKPKKKNTEGDVSDRFG
jgi:hypothetical protein